MFHYRSNRLEPRLKSRQHHLRARRVAPPPAALLADDSSGPQCDGPQLINNSKTTRKRRALNNFFFRVCVEAGGGRDRSSLQASRCRRRTTRGCCGRAAHTHCSESPCCLGARRRGGLLPARGRCPARAPWQAAEPGWGRCVRGRRTRSRQCLWQRGSCGVSGGEL